MNIYESDYWKWTVFLQKRIGFWLFEKKRWKNYIAWIYVYIFTISFQVSMGVRLYNEVGVNWDIVIENTIGEIYLFAVMCKLTCYILYKDKLKSLYQKVASDWKIMRDSEELEVMHKYTAIGSRVVLMYSVFIIIGTVVFLAMPIFFPLLDFIIPLENATRPKALPYYAEYGIDIQEHYYPMITQAVFGGVGTITVFVTYDLVFMLIVHHVVGLFEVVKLRLSKAAEIACEIEEGKNIAEKDYYARRYIIDAIELHQKALSYVDDVEDCYTVAWLLILFLNMSMLGGGIYIILLKFDRPEEFFRYMVIFCAGLIHFYYIFLSGQKIIDSSEDIFDHSYGCKWYPLSEKSKQLIKIMMRKSLIRSELTGGKMFVLCMETYCNMMKTGFSGFTILNSS